ncbi:RHS repeat-associated core domain-containing protein [Kribbella sp. NPDC055071]
MTAQSDRRKVRSGCPLLRTTLTLLLSLALVAGNQQHGFSAAAAAPKPDPKITLRKDESVPGVEAKPVPRSADPAMTDATQPRTPRLTWPSAGVAEVAVPPPGDGTKLSRWNALISGTPAEAKQRAGQLPVWIGPSTDAAQAWMATGVASGPAKVRVSMSARQGDTLTLDVRRTDGVQGPGKVKLTLDYSAFQDTYGGGWSNRLRLYDAKTGKSIASSNNGGGTLQAEVSTGATFTLAAAPGGGGGDYSRGDLSGGAAKWSIGGPSGAFEWSMPIESPPGMGGPQPVVALQYSSASLDGLTSGTNTQVSAAGQGFDLSGGGTIERRFKSCSKDPGNNGSRLTGDLCFATENASISMGGKSGDMFLVAKSSTSETWRLRGDDGTVVEKLWGATNGDEGVAVNEKGEYWRVTSKDGTKYYFGLNRLPGWESGKTETKSAMTMPVFGNNAGEQCNKTAYADSWCQQAYRWNLDYVVDRHGNTMSLFYDPETGNYARNLTATAVSSYVRGSNLRSIEYGQRDGQVYTQNPVGKVLFTLAERCEGANCGPAQPASYPDTPWDLNCASTTDCNNHFTPTFWTQKRLSQITTQVWRPTGFSDVQKWTLRHEYTNGAGTGRALWLEGVSNTGKAGGDLQLPETNFDGIGLDNRVDLQNPNLPNMVWYRIQAVHYGTGGDLAVVYSDKQCTANNLPDPAENTKLCRPQRWTPQDQGERQDWFHKYVVTEANEVDRSAATSVPAAPVVVTSRVEYVGNPAWHYDEQDGLADTTTHTWNQWRGYEKVRVYKGAEGETQSLTQSQYFRGLNGDRKGDGTSRSAQITDSTGTSVDDLEEFTGEVREQITYNGAAVVNKTINDYWRSAPTATEVRPWGTRYAYMTAQKAVTQYQAVDGGVLDLANRHEYDTKGRLLSKQLANDVSTLNDDTCTRYEYLDNPTVGLQELVSREWTVSTACDQAWSNDQVLSDEQVYYDDHTSLTDPPTRGVPTRGDRLAGFQSNGRPKYETVFTASFDAYGRRLSVTNALNQTSRISYEPAYGPTTKVTETAPNGMQSVEEYEPAWGARTAVISPDGKRTDLTLDPVGRTAKVWNPGHPKATSPADVEYEYLLRGDASSAVTTRTRLANGVYDTAYELYDGLQRLRQTQEPAPGTGRLVTDYRYDSRGRQSIVSGPYFNAGAAGTEILYVNDLDVPKQQVSLWDGADRPSAQIYFSDGQEKYRTSHQVTATRQSIDPPQGQAPTTRITDARGRLTELRTYRGDTWTGAYDSTKYTYTQLGQLKSITDATGNVWSYQYDIQGRRIAETDPDRGTTTYAFNAADQIESSTDARGVTLGFTYDELGRRTSQRAGSPSGTVQLSWTFDTLAKGRPTSTTRYVNGNAYTTAVTGYDDAGRPTGNSVTLPASEGALAGTYVTSQTYTDDGKVATRSLPAAGDLAAETLTVDYSAQSLPTAMRSELGTYVRNSTYTPYEETDVLTLGASTGKWVQQRNEYEYGTRRLTRVVTDRETAPKRISDTEYNYDPAGNVTKITDTPSTTTGEVADTQCFDYDYLRRLTQAWTPGSGDCTTDPTAAGLGGPTPYWQSWTFDTSGNRLSEQKVTPTGATTTSTYTYGADSHPNALKSVTTTSPTGTKTTTGYGYDAIGNLTSRTQGTSTETLSWTDDGKLAGSSKGSSFVYDGDGNRILRKDSSGTTLYVGETEILLGANGKLSGTRYYTFGDDVVAVRTGSKLSWLLSDLHGTPNIAVDAADQTVQRRRTTPYGDLRGTAPTQWPGQRGFHTGTMDPDTGFVQLGAREYDQSVGRFISVDPEIDPESPEQLNAYAYANNNPVSFEDSDGRFAFVIIPIVIASPEIVAAVVIAFVAIVVFIKDIVRLIVWVAEKVWNFLCWLWDVVSKPVVRWIEHFRTETKLIEQLVLKVEIRIVQRIKWIVKKIADKVVKPLRKPDVVKPKPNQPTPRPKPETPKPPQGRPEGPTRPPNKPDTPTRGNASERIKQQQQQRREDQAEQKRRMDELQQRLNEQLDNPPRDQWKAETQKEVDPDPVRYPDGTPKWKKPYDSKDFSSARGAGLAWRIYLGGELIRRAFELCRDWGIC